MQIGVISDTHGLLRPKVFEIFEGVDEILHAGDIGPPELLIELATIAPVQAVYGNCDGFPIRHQYTETWSSCLNGTKVFMTHIGGPLRVLRKLHHLGQGMDVVIYGHSHRPLASMEDDVLLLNPGAAGPRRFSLPATVALLDLSDSRPNVTFMDLETGQPWAPHTGR